MTLLRCISQGSMVIFLRCMVGNFKNTCVKFLKNCCVYQKLLKSVDFWLSYSENNVWMRHYFVWATGGLIRVQRSVAVSPTLTSERTKRRRVKLIVIDATDNAWEKLTKKHFLEWHTFLSSSASPHPTHRAPNVLRQGPYVRTWFCELGD